MNNPHYNTFINWRVQWMKGVCMETSLPNLSLRGIRDVSLYFLDTFLHCQSKYLSASKPERQIKYGKIVCVRTYNTFFHCENFDL